MSHKKSNREKNPYLKRIVKFLKNNPRKTYKKKEISRALEVHKDEYYLYRKALGALVDAGKVARLKGGVYGLPRPKKVVAKRDLEGPIMMTRKGFGFIHNPETGEDAFIAGSNLYTALDGDIVSARLFKSSRGKSQEAQVVEIQSRARTSFVGTYKKSGYYGFVIPDNPKVYRDFFIPEGASLKAKSGQKVVVQLDHWEPGELNPEGSITKVLGFPGDPGVDVESVVMGHGLELNFEKQLEANTAAMTLDISKQEVARRLDLRDEMIFTIDPPDAKDFDDAISLKQLENGNYYLGVHIADVSHFVKAGSPLDEEALNRGTSIYLVDRVVPMLPEHLSNKLCSLQPHEDRFTFSCFMEVNGGGRVVDYRIVESVINSKRRFTYQEAQDIIDDEKSKDPFASLLKDMHKFSRMLRGKRQKAGSVDFSTPEVRFILDDKGQPVDIIPVNTLHTNEMIEEFMLMANKTVARHIRETDPESNPLPFVYRIHEKPDMEKLQKFRNFMHALGHKIEIRQNITPAAFQKILKEVEGGADEKLIKEVALRTMMKAVYSINNAGHFGLAFKDYTHFTSPIRRYPDLIVHRLLKEYAAEKPGFKRIRTLKKHLKHVCQVSSDMERKAQEAERESIRLKQVEWIAKHQDQSFDGVVSGVTAFGIFVETIPYLIEGLVRVERMTEDYYIFDEKTFSMIGKDTGQVFRLGDPVKVRVSNIDHARNEVDFEFVDADF